MAQRKQAAAFEAAKKDLAAAIDKELRTAAAAGNVDDAKEIQNLKSQLEKEDTIAPPRARSGGPS